MRKPKLVERAHSNEPTVNIPTAHINIFLEPNLSDNQPLRGISSARIKT